MKSTKQTLSALLAALLPSMTLIGCAQAEPEATASGAEQAADPVQHLEDTAQFAQIIASGTVLVDFYADWCGPCRMMTPTLKTLATDMKDQVTVLKVNVDQHRSLAQEYRVSSIPYLVLFKDGKPAGQRVGVQNLDQLRTWLAE